MRPFLLSLVVLESGVILLLLIILLLDGPEPAGARPGAPAAGDATTDEPSPLREPASGREKDGEGPLFPPEKAERKPAATPPPPLGGGLLYGRITGPDEKAWDSFLLSLRPRGGGKGESFHGRFAESYAFTGIPFGKYELVCQDLDIRTRVIPVTIPDARPRRRDIEVSRKLILPVRFLTPGGEPLLEALKRRKIHQLRPQVVATVNPLAGDLAAIGGWNLRTYGVGRWLENHSVGEGNREAGRLVLERAPPVHASLLLGHALLKTERIGAGRKKLDFILSPHRVLARTASVTLRLEEGGGRIPPQARAILESYQSVRSGRPDENGNIGINHLPPGFHLLRLRAEGLGGFDWPLLLAPEEKRDLGTIRLDPPVSITGRVLDSGGRPAGSHVEYHNLDHHRVGLPLEGNISHSHSHVCTRENGFRIDGLQPGIYLLRAVVMKKGRDAGHHIYAGRGWKVVHATTDLEGVTIRAASGPSLSLRNPPGEHCLFTLLDRAGRVVATSCRPGFDNPSPGSYTLLVHRGGKELLRRPIRVKEGKVDPIDLGGGR